MSIWYDRSKEFRTILLKKDPKLLTKKSNPSIKSSKVINLIKNQILPGINTLQTVIADSKHDYLYTFDPSEHMKFDQSCSDSLKSNIQMIQHAETVLKIHLSDSSTSKNYTADQVKFYTMVIKLVKNYFHKVSETYRDLQIHFAKIKKFEQESKKIGVKKTVKYEENSNSQGYELNLDDSQTDAGVNGDNFTDEVTQMQAEFNDMATEITEIAQTVEEIAKLSTRMTEQVDIQYEMVEQIGNNVTNANNDVMEGNMEIRSAIQNNASTRSAIIFFLFMSSFLLFALDWYTDKFDS